MKQPLTSGVWSKKKTLLHNDVGLPGPHGHIQVWLSMIPQHLHTPHSPGTSLSGTTSPSSTDQLITHLQLPSQVCVSSGCSEKRHVISIPTAPADCSFQFTFRCSLCRLHPLVPLPEAMSCNCSRFFGDSVSQKAEPQLQQLSTAIMYAKCISFC